MSAPARYDALVLLAHSLIVLLISAGASEEQLIEGSNYTVTYSKGGLLSGSSLGAPPLLGGIWGGCTGGCHPRDDTWCVT